MAKETIVVIDYGSGNLRSAAKAFEHVCADEALDFEVIVSGEAEDVFKASRIVLPGQGAFKDCMKGLSARPGMIEVLQKRVVNQGIPFLGICVGMQLMASRGLEHGGCDGLNWIEGEVVPLQPNDQRLKIPHMGWNELQVTDLAQKNNASFVLRSIDSSPESEKHFYFVHSFMFECRNSDHSLAITDYGGTVTAVIGRDNMVGVQFHPEKSQQAGLQIISDFLQWRP